jgi:hypothetical protein
MLSSRTFFLVVAAFFIFATPIFSSTPPQPGSAERQLFDLVNRERTSLGLQPFKWDSTLADAARPHALLMARRAQLSHQFPDEPPVQDRARQAGAHFSQVAENVAVGPNPSFIHTEWMHSPGHRANILDATLNSIGIAVVQGGAGLYAVQDFSQSVANLSLQEQEQQIASLLRARGLQIAASAEDARKTCSMERGWSGGQALAMSKFETTDLSRLPEDIERRIKSGKYHSAAVGACDSGGENSFSHFRLAILLY